MKRRYRGCWGLRSQPRVEEVEWRSGVSTPWKVRRIMGNWRAMTSARQVRRTVNRALKLIFEGGRGIAGGGGGEPILEAR